MGPILELRGVFKSFEGLRAVDDVSFSAGREAITSLIGPNGAGKTTIFNLISGFLTPDAGTIHFRDAPIQALPPFAIARRGLARSFQDPRVYPAMSVLENVMVGIRQSGEGPLRAVLRGRRVNAEWRKARERSMEMLAAVGLADRAKEPAGDLSFGEQRFVSITRCLVGDPSLILMDEPTVGLDTASFDKLLHLMRRLVERDGKALLVIEHNMDAVMSISDTVVLLVQGVVVTQGPPGMVKQHRSMIEAYLGPRHAAANL